MLKVVIIDDEPLIRKGLSLIMNWESLGYEVAGVADNGYSGYQMIVDTQADVAIVDIMMPEMNGIKLAEKLKEDHINCKIIFLTAYAEFEYAKKSIELDVYSYILKPVEERELEKILISISDLIRKEQQVKKLTEDRMLERILRGDIMLLDELRKQHRPITLWKDFQLVILENDRNDQDYNSLTKELTECINDSRIFKGDSYVFHIDGYIGMLTGKMKAELVFRIISTLQNEIDKNLHISPYIYVGEAVASLEEISATHDTIKKFMAHRFLYNYKKIILCTMQELKATQGRKDSPVLDAENLYDAICTNNTADINGLMDEYREYHKNKHAKEEYIKLNYYNLYSQTTALVISGIPELTGTLTQTQDILNQIHQINSLQELHGFMNYQILHMADKIKEMGLDTPIAKILDYIDRNYDKDLKIEKIAEIMHYSSSYIGKMIKAEVGESFNTYLNNKRIAKAMELLVFDDKITEVAKKVGYKDCNLFNTYFKKTTGYTPTEYRRIKQA